MLTNFAANLKYIVMQTPRQKEIIEAALELISLKGIQGLTIKNLSKEIGISEPAIYRHYDGKIHILMAILEVFRQNTEHIFKEELERDLPAMEKISLLFARNFDVFSQSPSLVPVIFSEEMFRSEPQLMEKVYEIISRNLNALIKIIEEGQKSNEIRNDVEAEQLAVIILGSLRLFMKKWQFSDYSFDIKKEGRKLIKTLKRLIYKGILTDDE